VQFFAQEDFKATTVPSVELCPCSNQAYEVTVENTGSTASSYRVLANKELSDWITFSPGRFALNPGQKGSFSVIVNSACNIEDTFDLEIFIATDTGLAKVLKQQLKFLECYDYSLEQGDVAEVSEEIEFTSHDGTYDLCKNEQKAIPILITNNENFANAYKLKVDAPEWASLNANDVQLNAKKSGVLLINYDTTDVEGEFDFRLDAISRLGEVQRKKSIEVNVGECYVLDIDIEKENDVVCGGEENVYGVVVENAGTLGRNIEIEVEGPAWASVGNGSFYLESGSEKSLNLEINPEDDVSGNFAVEVFYAADNKADLRFSDTIALDVVPGTVCYEAGIDVKASVTNFYSREFISAKIRNNGIRNTNYSVSVEGPSWISASPQNLQLKPKQSGNVNIEINPGGDVEESVFDVKLSVKSKGKEYSKDFKVQIKKESEFAKKLKDGFRLYQYYIYVLLAAIVLVIIFIKPIKKFIRGTKKRYERYKEKRERIAAARAARKEREKEKEEQKRTEREGKKEEEKKQEEGKKALKKTKKKSTKKSNPLKILIYVLIIIAVLILIGHQNKLFNAKYLNIYISNFFVSYLYYLLIGIGAVVVLFLLFLFYNFVMKKGKSRVKREAKNTEKRTKKKAKRHKMPYFKILIGIIIAALITLANIPDIDFGVFGNVKDFLVLYQIYFLSGIAILVTVIFLIRFYRPLFKFLRE